jgi:uncharacterized membrane protein YgdD (TMEM256/DUF423 family)
MRWTLLAAAVGGFLAVAIGAFAAHGLRGHLDAQQLAWIDIAVRYQTYHSLALVGVAALMAVRPARLLSAVAGAFALGALLFSGSLYGLAFSGLRNFALITPFGGGFFLVGWGLLGCYAWRLRSA